MYSVEGTTITLTRGDTFEAHVMPITETGEEYVLQEGDTIRFAMKKNYKDETPLILKNIDTDTLVLRIEPSETKELSFGSYVYDIELTTATGDLYTFITESSLIIAKEVH